MYAYKFLRDEHIQISNLENMSGLKFISYFCHFTTKFQVVNVGIIRTFGVPSGRDWFNLGEISKSEMEDFSTKNTDKVVQKSLGFLLLM